MPSINYRGKIILSALLLLSIIAVSCRKLYSPPSIVATNSYLVVEGVINSGSDSTFIKLSRTVKISNKTATNPELNAILNVEGDQNTSYPLKELGNGVYACTGLNLNSSRKYRLSITTASNKQYLSDYVPVLNSPPIDSINFDIKGTVSGAGLNIYANTHDASNQVRYYRWEYQETWIIHPAFESFFKSNGDTVLNRDLVNDNIYTCWQNDTSSNIVLASSAKLSQNIIYNNPILSIPSTSEKLGDEYSILVKQYALTPEAYSFYTSLKKNTEQLGSIFDAQPSEITGNIHNTTNPNEPVVGYVSVTNAQSKRVFIAHNDLPGNVQPIYPYDCKEDTALYVNKNGFNDVQNILINQPIVYVPTSAIAPRGIIIGYMYSSPECVDCTLRGTTQTPPYWQ